MVDDKENGWGGTLWTETESVIHKKGSITHRVTGEKRYIAICESKNNEGKSKYELMMSLGLIYVNMIGGTAIKASEDILGFLVNPLVFLYVYKYELKNPTANGNEFT